MSTPIKTTRYFSLQRGVFLVPQEQHILRTSLVSLLAPWMLFCLSRYRCIASRCAQKLHIQPGVAHRAQPNAVLEKVFTSITKVGAHSLIFTLSRWRRPHGHCSQNLHRFLGHS